MTITDASGGRVEYSWLSDGSDTDTSGSYEAEVEVVNEDTGRVTTFPSDGYREIRIIEDIA
jgi:hypothetical protein